MRDQGGWRGPKGYVTPTPADTYVNAYRKWFDAVPAPPYAEHSTDHLRGLPLSKEALLDRYSQHTAHCSSCQGALRNAKRCVAASRRLLFGAAALLPWLVSARWAAASEAACKVWQAASLGKGLGMAHVVAGVKAFMGAVWPLLALAAFCGVVDVARKTAISVEQRLTSGMHEYPPPRNLALGAKGAARELRTVEQGRSG